MEEVLDSIGTVLMSLYEPRPSVKCADSEVTATLARCTTSDETRISLDMLEDRIQLSVRHNTPLSLTAADTFWKRICAKLRMWRGRELDQCTAFFRFQSHELVLGQTSSWIYDRVHWHGADRAWIQFNGENYTYELKWAYECVDPTPVSRARQRFRTFLWLLASPQQHRLAFTVHHALATRLNVSTCYNYSLGFIVQLDLSTRDIYKDSPEEVDEIVDLVRAWESVLCDLDPRVRRTVRVCVSTRKSGKYPTHLQRTFQDLGYHAVFDRCSWFARCSINLPTNTRHGILQRIFESWRPNVDAEPFAALVESMLFLTPSIMQ